MAKDKMTIPSSKVSIALEAGATEPAMKAAEAKSTKLYNVPIEKIKPIPGFNVRVDSPDYRNHRDMLVESMRANGYDRTKALAGFVAKEGDENVIYVTDGHTRLDAASILAGEELDGFNVLPVIVRTPAPSLTDLTVALHTNNTGRPLTPFELGVVVKRLLKEEGSDKATIAKRLAVTPRYLDDVLLLVNAPKKVRDAVLEGQVSSTMAIQEVRKAGDEPQKAVDRITSAVEKATAAGKKRATAKDTGPKMQKVRSSVSVATGTSMKDIVKAVAQLVRDAVKASGEGDARVADTDGTINLVIEVPAAEDPVVAAAPKKAAPKPAKAAEPAPKKSTPKKAKTPKAADPAPVEDDNIAADDGNIPADDDSGDLGIPGAEPVDPGDDEVAMLPPAVKNGEGVVDSSDGSDI